MPSGASHVNLIALLSESAVARKLSGRTGMHTPGFVRPVVSEVNSDLSGPATLQIQNRYSVSARRSPAVYVVTFPTFVALPKSGFRPVLWWIA